MRTIPPIVAGTATYVGDVRLPGMLHARVVHPPALGSTLVSVGTLDKKHFPNTQIVVKGNLVAVVDPLEYEAIEAASVLARSTKWTDVERPAGQRQPLRARCARPTGRRRRVTTGRERRHAVGRLRGRREEAVARPTSYPYEKHAPIGPTAAVADVRRTGWSTSTSTARTRRRMRWELAMMLNTTTDKVVVRNFDGSGHYGRSNGGSTGAEDEAVDHLAGRRQAGAPAVDALGRHAVVDAASAGVLATSRPGLDASGKLVAFQADHYMPGCRTTGWSERCSPG